MAKKTRQSPITWKKTLLTGMIFYFQIDSGFFVLPDDDDDDDDIRSHHFSPIWYVVCPVFFSVVVVVVFRDPSDIDKHQINYIAYV